MAFPHPLSLPSQGPVMNSIPTDHYTPSDDHGLSLIPFTTHQREPKGKEAFYADLFSYDNLGLGDFGDDNHAVPVPQVPQGTLPRNMKPVLHPISNSPQHYIWSGETTQAIPQTPNPNAHPPSNVHPAAAVPQPPTFAAFDSAHAVFPDSSSSHLGVSSSAAFDGGAPRVHAWQGATPKMRHEARVSGFGFNAYPQPNVHLAVGHQPTLDTFDGAFSHGHSPQPSALLPATSSSTVERGGAGQAAPLSSIQNIPFPMTSRLAPAWPSSTPVVPISESPIGAPVPHLRPLPVDAGAVAMGSAAAVAPATITANFAHATELRQVPASHGWCPECVRPPVRVDNTIEWVRPDVMKVVLYFNFSSNAEAEAQSSREPWGA